MPRLLFWVLAGNWGYGVGCGDWIQRVSGGTRHLLGVWLLHSGRLWRNSSPKAVYCSSIKNILLQFCGASNEEKMKLQNWEPVIVAGEKRDIMNEYLRGSTGCPFGLSSMKVVSWMLPSASVMSLLIIVLIILTSLLREEIVNMPHTFGIMVFVNLQLHTQIWACKMCAISLLCSDLLWAHLLFRSW